MDKEKAIELAKEYANIVSRHFSVKEVILYGSYASNRAHEYSDIDIAVIVSELNGDFLDAEKKLYKLRREIDLRIEPVLIIDDEDISGFKERVLKSGIKVLTFEPTA
ncbi:nucleotidyltransferase domain-containing protein [Halanaerobiaceae bacterium Z-7014]|uniref:Nucleotidyltransferase domain-containing protein n=1 Tax=Halonatronomonas betaini TaxID=2778430 RepID=A0A931AXB1_9FIRM|nr:nucleotidyltransferase domain-containing protein [Halonatronomonas betaini]MBF8438215.1 nucleotidyltransferase domain-containing protein [Halonatronomonas betaini]